MPVWADAVPKLVTRVSDPLWGTHDVARIGSKEASTSAPVWRLPPTTARSRRVG